MPKFNEFMMGKKGKVKQATTLTPEQQTLMKLINEGLTSGEGAFADLFGSFNPKEFEEGVTKPALANFQNEILPMLQEKFIAGNQALGSGMQRAQAKAGADLQSNLAQLLYQARQGHQQNRIGGLQNLLGTRAFENMYQPGTQGAAQGILKGVATGLGGALGGGLAGGIEKLVSGLGSAFGGDNSTEPSSVGGSLVKAIAG